MDIETVRLTEERLVNLWPAVSTLLMDGWAVRFAHGYSGRANSASALVPGTHLGEKLALEIEHLYRAAGLPPQFRITPLASPAVEPMLLARGYRVKDRSVVMTAQLDHAHRCAPIAGICIESAPGRPWLAGVSQRQSQDKRCADHLLAIVGQIRLPAAFATLSIANAPVGFAMAATDRGWTEIGSVILDAAYRGNGHGRALLDALLDWARASGAHHAFLQVTEENHVARRLYGRLGFNDLCGYTTLVRD